jgi:hypothetical protein
MPLWERCKRDNGGIGAACKARRVRSRDCVVPATSGSDAFEAVIR